MSNDDQDQSELLDDDKLPDEYPPDEPMGVDTYGTTAAEERAGEPITEAIARENADYSDRGAGEPVPSVDVVEEGPDEDERDVAQEREGAQPAEEAALHIEQG